MRALTEIAAIAGFIAESSDSQETARRFGHQLRQRCAKLASQPAALGRPREELAPGLRSVAFRNYVIFFRYSEDRLEVVSVLEGHRDMDRLFREDRA